MYLRAAILLILLPLCCFHRNTKERIDRSKHGRHLHRSHLFPANTEINEGGKQTMAPPTETDNTNSPANDASLRVKAIRTRRNIFDFNSDWLICEDEFGIAIKARVCDGIYDCANKLDEEYCHNGTCPSVLSVRCEFCYNIEKRCDGEQHCPDNSDEENCDNIVCPDYFFQCDSGQCVFYLYQCDDYTDCSDKSDELNCQPQLMYPNCTENDYLCPNGKCMRRAMICDSLLRNTFEYNNGGDCLDEINEFSCADYNCFDPDYVKCNSGHCIDWKLWCNSQSDCDDGSDESSCGNHKCPDPNNFQCATGHCIDQADWCDILRNCPDGSDENSCENFTCPFQDYEFQCKSGHCIASILLCDNRVDCPDGSDEHNCHNNYSACPMLHYRCNPEECYPISKHCNGSYAKNSECYPHLEERDAFCDHACPDGFFKCYNGQCVLYHFVCNGVDDCNDKSDEYYCSDMECLQRYHRCSNGQCISRVFICEYVYSYEYRDYINSKYSKDVPVFRDCSDNVTCDDYICIDQRAFHCYSGHCIEPNSRCDTRLDCPDGSDESSCDNHTCVDTSLFQCNSGHCISGDSRCDITLDCLDGSDEMNCARDNITCPMFLYRCNSGQCYDTTYRCDGDQHCPDNSDEGKYCLNATCPGNFFRCHSGQCVPYHIRCDGETDCTDESDEYNCPDMYCPDEYYRCRDGRCISLTFICDAFYWTGQRTVCTDDFNYVSCTNYTCIQMDEYTPCENGHCFLSEHRCNNIKDCTDGSDEKECGPDCMFNCLSTGKCIDDESKLCDFEPHCHDWSDEANCHTRTCSSSEYQCKTGHCIPVKHALCGGYFWPLPTPVHDCPIFHDDEIHCPFSKCPSNYLRMPTGSCSKPVTYNISCSTPNIPNRCPRSCPNDIYYRQCCNCQCVHRVSICDGVHDCPDGADERDCGKPDCRVDQFYCGTMNCFPSEYICDGYDHCLGGHDETSCKLNQTNTFAKNSTSLVEHDTSDKLIDYQEQCIDPSICLTQPQIYDLLAYYNPNTDTSTCHLFCSEPCTCSRVGIMRCDLRGDNTTLNISANTLWPFNAPSVLDYRVDDSQPKYLFFIFELMSEISITNASLTQVPTRLLSCAFNIHYLNLSNNAITHIAVGDFGRLYRLSILDLSNNLISSIEDYSFKGIRVLHLKLDANRISNFGIDLFSGMAADGTIKTDEYRFCCLRPTYFPEENCYPKADQFSSCKDLMKNSILRVMLWIVGLFALIGNVGIFLYKIIVDRESLKHKYGVMIINLALADALMGIYLLSIASVDVMYRGIYVTKENEWRNSIGCKLLGTLCTISSEASVLFICLITVDRYLITKFPFGQVRLSQFVLNIICICIWIFAIVIATTPFAIASYFKGNYFSKSGVCIALPLTTESYDGWEYSFAINVCLNGILFLVVGIGQCLIYKEFSASRSQSLVSTRRKDDMQIARRLMYIVISDFLCWIPIGVMGILASSGVKIHPEVYAWVTVFVLPINSALNPFLYTLIALCTNVMKQRKGPSTQSTKSTRTTTQHSRTT